MRCPFTRRHLYADSPTCVHTRRARSHSCMPTPNEEAFATAAAAIKAGLTELPTVGDGRQSGTSASPSILNASPEAAVGGGLALLKTGDRVKVDLNARRVDMLVDDTEIERRRAAWTPNIPEHQTPWQEIYRSMVGQLDRGACLEPATLYLNVADKILPRHNH